jgi:hypothetical protein
MWRNRVGVCPDGLGRHSSRGSASPAVRYQQRTTTSYRLQRSGIISSVPFKVLNDALFEDVLKNGFKYPPPPPKPCVVRSYPEACSTSKNQTGVFIRARTSEATGGWSLS